MKKCKKLLVLVFINLLIITQTVPAQIYNGSFEINGGPTLDGWIFTCLGYYESFQDSPIDSSGWCLKLASGSTQGCFPSFAYQFIDSIKDGDIWQASVWTKRDVNIIRSPCIYWILFKEDGSLQYFDSTLITSTDWIQIFLEDTLEFNKNDSIALVLDAGLSGPITPSGYTYFDIVEVEKIGNINSINENSNITSIKLYQNYPNPFTNKTTIFYQLPENIKNAKLCIFNIDSQLVKIFKCKSGYNNIKWDATDFKNNLVSAGIYFYQIINNNMVIETKKMILTK